MLMRVLFTVAVCLTIAPSAFAEGDAEYGEYLSAECVTCHQASGADEGIPSITGWDPEAFIAVLQSYKNKERDNTAMQTIAARLDDEQMAALAAYFHALDDQED